VAAGAAAAGVGGAVEVVEAVEVEVVEAVEVAVAAGVVAAVVVVAAEDVKGKHPRSPSNALMLIRATYVALALVFSSFNSRC
jgi:hypothetical protein